MPSSEVFAAAIAAVVAFVYFVGLDWWKYRKLTMNMRKLGKPMLSWNPVFGHLLAIGRLYQTLPVGAHSCYLMYKITEEYFPNGAFYFDVWPLVNPMLVITEHEMANQVMFHSKTGARKPGMLTGWFHMISGGPNLFDLNGEGWKALHNIFSPAFSVGNVNKQVPLMIEHIQIFRGLLQEKAKAGDRVQLQPMMIRLITDIIGESLLQIKMDNQRSSHPLAETMARQQKYKEQQPSNPVVIINWFNPFRRYNIWNNSRLLDQHIRDQLMTRFRACKSNRATGQNETFRSVIDLAIEEYLDRPGNATAERPDDSFMRMATQNMRMFFFVGGPSTAGITVFCYNKLQRHPEALAKLRAEHDAILGKDVNDAPSLIAKSPALLSSLPYTQAVLKESLRLYPMADGLREGSAECVLVDAQGNRFPTEGYSVLVSHLATQTNPKHWVRPLEFLPDRWVVEPDHDLYPPVGSWRPFEVGPRACLGQQAIMTEVKAVLACTVREFDFKDCYPELDGKRKIDLSGVFGERAYMVESATAYPAGHYPCRITSSGYGAPQSSSTSF